MSTTHTWRKQRAQLDLIESGDAIGTSDFYPTPEWCTNGLLSVCPPRCRMVLEPAAGSGAIVRVLLDSGFGFSVRAVELRPRALPKLRALCPSEWGCWLRMTGEEPEKLEALCGRPLSEVAILTNPPFAIAADFTRAALETASPWVGMLLRLDVIASRTWAAIFNGTDVPREAGTLTPPTTMVTLRRRPSFTPDGQTSMNNYAWMIWEAGKLPLDLRPIG